MTHRAIFTHTAKIAVLLLPLVFLAPQGANAACPAGATCQTLNNFGVAAAAGDTDIVPTLQSGSTTVKQTLSAIWTWIQGHLAAPGPIGGTTPSTGAFTTLSASSTVAGTGFSNYLASPPAIGGTTPAAGTFNALTDTAMTGGPFCVHETAGVLAATAADCGSGGGGSGTVTSVGLSLPNIFSVSGSPVTTAGTLTGSLATETANTIFAGPSSGAAAAPTFRALASADLPGYAVNNKTASYSAVAGDLANALGLDTGTTPALTLPTPNIFSAGQSLGFYVPGTSNWTLTNSSGLTLKGLASTTLVPGTFGTFVEDQDGTHLDFFGFQVATATTIGGFFSKDCTSGGQFVQILGTNGSVTCGTPAGGGNVSAAGTLTSGEIVIGQGTTAVAVDANAALSAGALSLGASGTAGSVAMGNATSGTVTLQPATGALGTVTASLPANTGTIAELNLAQSWTGAQRGTPTNITISTATFTPNFDTAQNFEIDLTSACPCTLANPSTALVAGQSGMIEVHQDATGSRTIGTWGADYQYAGGTSTITLSTAANAVDYLPYYVNNAATGIVLGTILKAPAH